MHKAVFLDRDGVINDNSQHYYIFRKADFKLNEGVIEACQFLTQKGYLLFIVSNQGGISKGAYTKNEVDRLHEYLRAKLGKAHIHIKDILYCPHHSDMEKCFCRKPDSLLIEKILARHEIDPQESWFVGDSPRDVEAARKSNIRGIIQIPSNTNVFEAITKSIGER